MKHIQEVLMEQRISLITLGVTDLQRAVDFYEQVVGWKAEPSPPGVVFFDLNGLVFALWPHDELAKDLGMTAGSVPAYRGYSLAHNVRSEAEVDAIFARLRNHRATIVKERTKHFGADTPAIFPTRTVTCGKSPTTHSGRSAGTAAYRCRRNR
jgi:catechol 2,3-dioxygenase-like lactoylglutathione lyase family enzyme